MGIVLLLHLLGSEKLFAAEFTQREYLLRSTLNAVESGAAYFPQRAAHELVSIRNTLNKLVFVVNIDNSLVIESRLYHKRAFCVVGGVRVACKSCNLIQKLLARSVDCLHLKAALCDCAFLFNAQH